MKDGEEIDLYELVDQAARLELLAAIRRHARRLWTPARRCLLAAMAADPDPYRGRHERGVVEGVGA